MNQATPLGLQNIRRCVSGGQPIDTIGATLALDAMIPALADLIHQRDALLAACKAVLVYDVPESTKHCSDEELAIINQLRSAVAKAGGR